MNCYNDLLKTYNSRGDFVAVKTEQQSFTLKELLFSSSHFSNYLNSVLNEEECVSIFLPNSYEAIISFYACCKSGHNVNLIHFSESSESIISKMKATASHFLITNKSGASLLGEKASKISLFVIDEYKSDFSSTELLSSQKNGKIFLNGGGTSGENNTVILSEQNICKVCEHIKPITENLEYGKESSLLIIPFSHAFGLSVAMHLSLICGLTVIPISKFDVENVSYYLQNQNVSFLVGVPAVFEKLVNSDFFKGDFLKNFKLLFCGGDFVPEKLIENVNSLISSYGGKGKLYSGYGLTETASVCSVNTSKFNKPFSVGKPIDNIKINIVDENNNFCEADTVGEIAVCGDTVTDGYLNSQYQPFFYDKNSIKWLLTGDLGYLDNEGYLYITGRKKRVIIISGFNVYPAYLESKLFSLDYIKVCCAVQCLDNSKPAIKLFVVPLSMDNQQAVKNKIIEYIKNNFSKYYIPKEIEFVNSLPRTPLGKIDYKKLEKDVLT